MSIYVRGFQLTLGSAGVELGLGSGQYENFSQKTTFKTPFKRRRKRSDAKEEEQVE